MICPNCGFVDKSVPIPQKTKKARVLGICKRCGCTAFCIPSRKKEEASPKETIKIGEEREEQLVKIYIKYMGGKFARKRGKFADIDRSVFDENGKLIYHLEIKERSNTINAYRKTLFPYAKIEEAKKLTRETGKPTFIVLKFADCWARLKVEPEKDYTKGSEPFAPNYRPWQKKRKRQVPVEIDVEELEILNIKEECETSFQID